MIFGESYHHPMDREYYMNNAIEKTNANNLEKPISIEEVGMSVTEGRAFGGSFRETTKAAIRAGAKKIELSTGMEGGEELGAESYGRQAREELREIAEANEVEFVSVHAPANGVLNLSGFSRDQHVFSDHQRKELVDQVKKAIDFAADVARGGAVVVHTGEFMRPISEQPWAKEVDPETGEIKYRFYGTPEEPRKAVMYLVDKREGKLIGGVKKDLSVRIPKYVTYGDVKKNPEKYKYIKFDPNATKIDPITGKEVPLDDNDWISQDGKYIDPFDFDQLLWRVPEWNEKKSSFESKELKWDDFVKEAERYNKYHMKEIQEGKLKKITPEEMFFRTQRFNEYMRARGSSLMSAQQYDEEIKEYKKIREAYDFYKKLETEIPENEKWKIRRVFNNRFGELVPGEEQSPAEFLEKLLKQQALKLKYIRESSASSDVQADQILDEINNVVSVSEYALDKSTQSYAEAGIHAMQQSEVNPHVKKDIFVAPENIFPEMGFGSHPDELIELVHKSREKMVNYLTKEYIPDPKGATLTREEAERIGKPWLAGKPKMVKNPYYQPNISEEKAWQEAKQHIRATFDTQHLGMWRKNFQPIYLKDKGRIETKQETDERFKKWYMEQIDKLHKADILGHIHLVDSMGSGHHHLPAGQGDIPVVDAVKRLKELGYDSSIISEGYGEEQKGQGRQITETWKALGANVGGTYIRGMGTGVGGGGSYRWDDIRQSYFGQNRPPYYVFGSYSPSQEWTLWSQSPLE